MLPNEEMDFELPDNLSAGFSLEDESTTDTETPTPKITVTVSEDKLKAYLTIEQVPPLPYQVTEDDIFDALAAKQVEHGVKLERIEEIVANNEYPFEEIIAEGTPATPGQDGWLEYKIDLGAAGRPKDEGYRVDHYNLNLVQNVKPGDPLVELHPAVPGIPGKTVHGRNINPPRVQKVRLPKGKGTKISDENPNLLVAAVEGFVRLDRSSFNQLVVEQEYQIYGDVDLSTGNLDIDGSVTVNKTVREGFKVVATGNITVLGNVEGATLQAGGNITVRRGIVGGQQHAYLTAGGDVTAKFANNADISAGGAIMLNDEAINCTLESDTVIVVGEQGRRNVGDIIGGKAIAGYEIRAVNVGSDSGTKTILRVGEQPRLIERRRKMEQDLKDWSVEIEQLTTRIATLKQRQIERSRGAYEREQQFPLLKQQQTQLLQTQNAILEHAERSGFINPIKEISTLEEEFAKTTDTLNRVKASILAMFSGSETKKVDDLSPEDREKLAQLKLAHQTLDAKLKNIRQQITHRRTDPWKNLPAEWRQQLEQSEAQLKQVNHQLTLIEAEMETDKKIAAALAQSVERKEELASNLDALKQELEAVKEQISNQQNIKPRIIITGNLYAGTEVIIMRQRKEFIDSLKGVQIQLSGVDDKKRITVYGLD